MTALRGWFTEAQFTRWDYVRYGAALLVPLLAGLGHGWHQRWVSAAAWIIFAGLAADGIYHGAAIVMLLVRRRRRSHANAEARARFAAQRKGR